MDFQFGDVWDSRDPFACSSGRRLWQPVLLLTPLTPGLVKDQSVELTR
jgi:hypothetical protein